MREKKEILFEHVKGLRDVLKALSFIPCVIWLTIPATFGLLAYFILIKFIKLKWFWVLGAGVIIALTSFWTQWHYTAGQNTQGFFATGFNVNILFWKYMLKNMPTQAWSTLFGYGFNYLLGLPVFLAGLWATFDLIPNTAHEKELMAINKAQGGNTKEVNQNKINTLLDNLKDEDYDGTLLGVSKYNGKTVVVPDKYVNQIVLVLGTTGSGKTITLRRFYKRAAIQGYPLIIVDGKPTQESVEWLENLAKQHDRKFYGFNCSKCWHYNALAVGSYTELKDKIITLKDKWESDYYLSIAEDYLQGILEVLEVRKTKTGRNYDLRTVVNCLSSDELNIILREVKDEQLIKRAARLAKYDAKDITGLQAHLNNFMNSEIGEDFTIKEGHTFSLPQVIEENAIVYFALPVLKYPSYARSLGKLVVNDIKAVIDRNVNGKKIFTSFDEFSVFAGEQSLNLINMGRSKGVHAVFGTQGIADLKKVDENFAGQMLNCTNTVICHRINDQESAESIAAWVGTKDTFNLTAQVNTDSASMNTGLGSVRRTKEFIVHPDDIKQSLPVGEAFYITKVDKFSQDKVKVKYS